MDVAAAVWLDRFQFLTNWSSISNLFVYLRRRTELQTRPWLLVVWGTAENRRLDEASLGCNNTHMSFINLI